MNSAHTYNSEPDGYRVTSARDLSGGLDTRTAIREIRGFVVAHYSELDVDNDGFISKGELEAAFHARNTPTLTRAFIKFLLRQIVEKKAPEQAQGPGASSCISRSDIENYFGRFE
jgi:hypothetical protein